MFNTYAEWKIGLVAGFVLAATVAFVLAGSTGVGPGRRARIAALMAEFVGRSADRRPGGSQSWRWSRSFSYCDMTISIVSQRSNKREISTVS